MKFIEHRIRFGMRCEFVPFFLFCFNLSFSIWTGFVAFYFPECRLSVHLIQTFCQMCSRISWIKSVSGKKQDATIITLLHFFFGSFGRFSMGTCHRSRWYKKAVQTRESPSAASSCSVINMNLQLFLSLIAQQQSFTHVFRFQISHCIICNTYHDERNSFLFFFIFEEKSEGKNVHHHRVDYTILIAQNEFNVNRTETADNNSSNRN